MADFDIKAFMIGPKAENLDLFRRLVLEALDDHMYWRRNFYPEDVPAISSSDQHSPQFRDFEDRLRDLLFRFLADAKKGVPFFSPRYIGHMNTDLLLPALVGYFASMLYNQNNVAGESSPMTARLEEEVVGMLAQMVGMPVRRQGDGTLAAAGYLASGGTTANVYGLWLARNLRSWPVALRLALAEGARQGGEQGIVASILGTLEVPVNGGSSARLGELSAWCLLNLPLNTVYGIRNKCFEAVQMSAGDRYPTFPEARQAVERLTGQFTMQALGAQSFFERAGQMFPQEQALLRRPWTVIVARNKHYSWVKSVDLLGLGHSAIREVDIARDFTMDHHALHDLLRTSLERKEPVLAIASVFGSTEEGSLDDLPRLEEVRRDMEHRGLCAWLHVDACYGGYLGAMVRAVPSGEVVEGETLREWMLKRAEEFGLNHDGKGRRYVDFSAQPGWLTWTDFAQRVGGMKAADSLSVDPHKLGYVPYPAGAVILRDADAWDVVSFDAPYLWREQGSHGSSFVGRYTLEGSRAGAVAASCWLAHSAVPLSQEGHGKIVAASMLATRQLYDALASVRHPTVRFAFINPPHLNMLCYVPFHNESKSLSEIAAITRVVAAELSPTKKRDFMIVQTDIDATVTRAWLRETFGQELGDRLFEAAGFRGPLPVLRSVVMGPLSLGSVRRPDLRPLFEVYAEDLCALTERVLEEVRRTAFLDSFKPRDIILAMDNDGKVIDLLKGALADLRKADVDLRFYDSLAETLQAVDRGHTMRHAILDIDMGIGREDGGFEVFAAICRRNDNCEEPLYRVERVVFLTAGAQRIDVRCRAIAGQYRHAPAWQTVIKPLGGDDHQRFSKDLWKAMTRDEARAVDPSVG